MRSWQFDQLDALASSKNAQELFDNITRMAKGLGFEFCSYGVRSPFPVSDPQTVILSNYADAWQQAYAAQGYLAVDPSVERGARSVLPFTWSAELKCAAPAFWEHAAAHGLCHGWAQSSRDMRGCLGMLTLSRSEGMIEDGELEENELKMVWLTQIAHQGFVSLMEQSLYPQCNIKLSKREIEVLKLTADGKTSGEISGVLHVTASAVNFHLSNVLGKFEASNKTAAVIRAVLMGALS